MPIVKQLIADEFGTHIGKYSQQLKITRKGKTVAKAPLLHLDVLLVASRGVSISSDVLEACSDRGIPVHFIDSHGKPYGSFYSAGLVGTTITRRQQLLAYYDERSVRVALALAKGKVENQAATLKYLAKSRKESAPECYAELHRCAAEVRDMLAQFDTLAEYPCAEALRSKLMGYEAVAGKRYWQAVRQIIPEQYSWTERITRGATDPVNSLLNYGYAILNARAEHALVLAGLDPYAGFVHADRPGKPSLVLDFIEQFRQVAVDRVVFGLVNRNYTVKQDEHGQLEKDMRDEYAQKVLARLETQVPFEGKRHALRIVIQSQARYLATFLRGERITYEPFLAGW